MALKSGTQLGPYEITGPLGKGGMGEVYRATDTKLKRDVAIKVLPDSVAGDRQRLARFEREAHILASLNHPHIASIYGLEESGGVPCLVLELVEGETLGERLARGAVSVEDGLEIARQIASALEAAHEKGIVHRDLKPANAKITREGSVKVLDFGLATALAGEPGGSTSDPSDSPTVTAATRTGVILGTAAYMSPEQARGKRLDKRTDIWAFGCVVFELLTARKTFAGKTATDCIAATLEREPDWALLPRETPRALRVLLRRCLEKNPLNRLRDIGDARIVLAELQAGRNEGEAEDVETRASGGRGWAWLLFGLLLGFGAAALGGWMLREQAEQPELPVRRYRVAVAGLSESWFNRPLISRDGRRVVYVADDHLWVRDLNELEPRRLEDTKDARAPFWSPDGESLAFGRGGELRRIDVAGGPSRPLCDVPGSRPLYSGDWNVEDVIVFAVDHGPIYEVSARGGDPRVRVALDAEREVDFHSISLLPDGVTLLAQPHLLEKGLGIESEALLLLTGDGARNVVLSDESWSSILRGQFADGHIVYERRRPQKGIWANPFSLETLETVGDPFPVALHAELVSVARDGTMIFRQDTSFSKRVQPALVDREGNVLQSFGEPRLILPMFSISPDGRKAVFTVGGAGKGEGDLWIYDLQRGTSNQLTSDEGLESMPHWSPRGNEIVFVSGVHPSDFELRVVDLDDPREPESLGPGFRPIFSPKGEFLVYSSFAPPDDIDLWFRPVSDGAEPSELLATDPAAWDGRVSPDGRWIAYVVRGTKPQVYVGSFPDGTSRQQVSTDGGMAPQWSPRGDFLFYANGDDVLEVSISGDGALELGEPRKLFARDAVSVRAPDGWNEEWLSNLEVTPDGESFLILQPGPETDEKRPDEIVVIQNWLAVSSKR